MYPKRKVIEYKRLETAWNRMTKATNLMRICVFLADIADYQFLSNTKKIVDELLEKLTFEERSCLKSASLPYLMEKYYLEVAFNEFPKKYINQIKETFEKTRSINEFNLILIITNGCKKLQTISECEINGKEYNAEETLNISFGELWVGIKI